MHLMGHGNWKYPRAQCACILPHSKKDSGRGQRAPRQGHHGVGCGEQSCSPHVIQKAERGGRN